MPRFSHGKLQLTVRHTHPSTASAAERTPALAAGRRRAAAAAQRCLKSRRSTASDTEPPHTGVGRACDAHRLWR